MKDLGEVDVILGVKIRKNKTSLSLCQSHYMEKILKKFDSFDLSPVRTSFDASKHLKKNKGDSVSQPKYAKIRGSVMYLMNYTRPDIAYAVSRLSRYTHNHDRYHWDALRHLLRYLKGIINYCLHFNKFSAILEGYCDANWVTDNDEVNSTSGQQRSDGTRFSWVAVNMGGTRMNFNFSASWVAISHGLPSACVAGLNVSFYVAGRNASPSMLSVETSPSVAGRIARGSPC
ncbi:Retrovirus-related Pol polyprotein from transposon TNT 1-94 [Cucumis melo var. makuwa]|uniref:Retrovirus-related Pol polyprotein from transposon TNT 1-94 n=1 Tax=Cucumis melo var. makuwa TaxID=1194695 RepID=A0A5A7TW47_CUCMM|nr:Retrovirus-related Pol polyprotein from transposon TNT 1-94 [Cucumis melo var. makuwa]